MTQLTHEQSEEIKKPEGGSLLTEYLIRKMKPFARGRVESIRVSQDVFCVLEAEWKWRAQFQPEYKVLDYNFAPFCMVPIKVDKKLPDGTIKPMRAL